MQGIPCNLPLRDYISSRIGRNDSAASLCGLLVASTAAWCARRAAARTSFSINPFLNAFISALIELHQQAVVQIDPGLSQHGAETVKSFGLIVREGYRRNCHAATLLRGMTKRQRGLSCQHILKCTQARAWRLHQNGHVAWFVLVVHHLHVRAWNFSPWKHF